MSKAIKKGDLVMVVRLHCNSDALGNIFVVDRVGHGLCLCGNCGSQLGSHYWAEGNGNAFAQSWLRKLPPLTEPESITDREEMPA